MTWLTSSQALVQSLTVDKHIIIRKYTFQLSLQDAYNLPLFLKQYFRIKPPISSKYCLRHFEQGFLQFFEQNNGIYKLWKGLNSLQKKHALYRNRFSTNKICKLDF